MTATFESAICVCGDTLSVVWTGAAWQAPSDGSQHASKWAALAVELRAYLAAGGDDVSYVDADHVRANYELVG